MFNLDGKEIVKAGVETKFKEVGLSTEQIEKMTNLVLNEIKGDTKMLTESSNPNIHITTQSCNVNIDTKSTQCIDRLDEVIESHICYVRTRRNDTGSGQQSSNLIRSIFKKYLGIEDDASKGLLVSKTSAYAYVMNKLKRDLGGKSIARGIPKESADKAKKSLYESFSVIERQYNGGGLECLRNVQI